jgi:hypothetical protein
MQLVDLSSECARRDKSQRRLRDKHALERVLHVKVPARADCKYRFESWTFFCVQGLGLVKAFKTLLEVGE